MCCLGQKINFEPSKALFNHPTLFGNVGLGDPFIPFDYNNDGLTDFIGHTSENNVHLFKGVGNDQFQNIKSQENLLFQPLKVMDFDKDGDMDVVGFRDILLYESQDSFTVFDPEIGIEIIVEVADFDGDGLFDLLTTRGDYRLTIHYAQTDGYFTPEIILSDYEGLTDIEVTDIDQDGDLDIFSLMNNPNEKSLILFNSNNNFNPVFLDLPILFSTPYWNIKLVDFDSDSDLDIITLGAFGEVHILENTDNFQNFITSKIYPDLNIYFFSVADLDQDGDKDIVAYGKTISEVTLYSIENLGAMDFGTELKIEQFGSLNFVDFTNFNYTANNLNLYDYDGDGKLDITIVDGFGLNQIRYLKNSTASTSNNSALENNSPEFSVFPNPTIDKLNIKADHSYSSYGYKIFSHAGVKMDEGNIEEGFIDVSSLDQGIYFVKIDNFSAQKFIKK